MYGVTPHPNSPSPLPSHPGEMEEGKGSWGEGAWPGFSKRQALTAARHSPAQMCFEPLTGVAQGPETPHHLHPAAAQRLYEYLSRPEVSRRLADWRALEGATLDPATAASGLTVDWNQLLQNLDSVTTETKEIFLR